MEEFGSADKIRFACFRLYDAEGNEIEIPSCKKCNSKMNLVIDNEAQAWICSECQCSSYSCEFVYRPPNYTPCVIDAKPSPECNEYHKISKIHFILDGEHWEREIEIYSPESDAEIKFEEL